MLLILKCVVNQRREKKKWDEALDRLLADVAVRCIKIDAKEN